MIGLSGIVDIGKRVASDFSEKNVTFMAAGIAYNAFVSLAPLLIILVLIVSVIGGDLERRLIAAAESGLPGPIAAVVTQILTTDSGAASASIVGVVVLLWGTLKIFRGLDTAFSEIYETVAENSFLDKLVDGLVVLVALIVSIVATVGASAVFARLADQIPSLGYLSPLVLVIGLVIAFFPMYYRFPDTALTWRDVIPGTVFAAVGWAAFQALFQVYLAFGGGGGVGGFFGGILVVVTWLYFSGLVLLLGAVLNAVIGGHSSGEPGGIGRGASGKVQSRKSLAGDELAGYLSELREELTGRYEGMVPAAERPNTPQLRDVGEPGERDDETDGAPAFGPLDGEVDVVEQFRTDGDEREQTVTLRWRTPGGGSEE
jgi:membrane protein